MSTTTNKSHLTAISRSKLSAPMRYLRDKLAFPLDRRCLDYGCGRGHDCDALGLEGYDPHWRPHLPGNPSGRPELPGNAFAVITCNYVLNVIPEEFERRSVMHTIWCLLADDGVAYITVRNDRKALNGRTSKGTWQGFIELDLPIEKKTAGYVMYRMTKNDTITGGIVR